jgi:hypothetical protein
MSWVVFKKKDRSNLGGIDALIKQMLPLISNIGIAVVGIVACTRAYT